MAMGWLSPVFPLPFSAAIGARADELKAMSEELWAANRATFDQSRFQVSRCAADAAAWAAEQFGGWDSVWVTGGVCDPTLSRMLDELKCRKYRISLRRCWLTLMRAPHGFHLLEGTALGFRHDSPHE